MLRINQIDLAGEAAGQHVLGQDIADRAPLGARADNGNRAGGEGVFKIANRHECSCADLSGNEILPQLVASFGSSLGRVG